MGMAKSYSDELAEWVRRRPSSKRDKNMVAFLAVRDDVEEALAKGYPVSTIWAHMYENKRVAFRYEMFLHYVNRHVRRQKAQPMITATTAPNSPAAVKTTLPKLEKQPPVSIVKSSHPSAPAGFTFNAAPNKEELL
jgi:hypothetical protein